jgi:hypothetical protein
MKYISLYNLQLKKEANTLNGSNQEKELRMPEQ